jgi:hypothetical protein
VFIDQPWGPYIKDESWMDRVDRGGDPCWPELRDDTPEEIRELYEEFKRTIGHER